MDHIEERRQNYLKKFTKKVHPKDGFVKEFNAGVPEIAEEIVNILKEKELTYVDAYATLEYVYRKLQFMSEFTHI